MCDVSKARMYQFMCMSAFCIISYTQAYTHTYIGGVMLRVEMREMTRVYASVIIVVTMRGVCARQDEKG